MKTIVAATQNTGKLAEIRYIMRDWPVEILSLADIGLADFDVEETGASFVENALIKARAVKPLTDYMVLSDDSGICVDALDGQPGIYSARFGGDVSFAEKRQKLLQMMKAEPNRAAHFRCVVALIDEQGREITGDGRVDGVIAQDERGEHGFGYDALFEIPDGRTFGEIEFEEKHNLSHRYHAIEALRKKLQDDKATGIF